MSDPRPAGVLRRLAGVGRIIAFCSAKGGVGKSFCAAAAGVSLARAGRAVGLLDLDLSSAAAHLFLGVPLRLPDEDRGILPLPVVEGLSLMSAAAFTRERGLALRGAEVSDAIVELLCATQWGGRTRSSSTCRRASGRRCWTSPAWCRAWRQWW